MFSYRLGDALQESGDAGKSAALFEKLLLRINEPASDTQPVHDVRGRILYRVAIHRLDAGERGDALELARQAVSAFALSGIIAPERRAAIALLADLLSESGATAECRQLLTSARDQAEKEGDFETLTATEQRLAAHESGRAAAPEYRTRLADL